MGSAVHPSFPGHGTACISLPPVQEELGHARPWASSLMATPVQPGISGLLPCEVIQLSLIFGLRLISNYRFP